MRPSDCCCSSAPTPRAAAAAAATTPQVELPAEALPPISRMRPGLGEGPGHLVGRERRYLGCVRLPLSAIYQTGVLEGTFKVS
jgi:hypothetical protein